MEHSMSRFTQYTLADAPAASKPLLEQVNKSLGFVPNLYATFAESPAVLGGYLALDASLAKGALSAVERQLVEIAVSVENDCEYCVAAHSTLAGLLHAPASSVAAVRDGMRLLDPKQDALVNFARAVVTKKGFASEADIAAFLGAGYSRAQAVEVIGHVGLKTIANYLNNLVNTPLDAQFEPQRWNPQEQHVS